MANEAQGVATTPSKDKSQGAAVPVRWPWLALGVAGLLIPLVWLFLGRGDGATGSGGRRADMAPAPGAPTTGRPNIRLDSRGSTGEANAAAPAAPAPVLATEGALKSGPPERGDAPAPSTPAPTTKDLPKKVGFMGGAPADDTATREAAKPAKIAKAARPKSPPRPAPAKPASRIAAGPIGPAPGAGLAPPPPPPPAAPMAQADPGSAAPAPPPPAARMAPGAVAAKPAASRQRALDADLDDASSEKKAAAEPAKPRPAKTSKADADDISDGVAPAKTATNARGGKVGSKQKEVTREAPDDAKPSVGRVASKKRASGGGRGGKGKGAASPPPPSPEAVPSEGADGEGEVDGDVASLQPGWFGAKIPEQMNLNESSRVRVTVTREENKAKGKAKLDAMAPTQGPAKVVEQDILVGKFLRVELRAFASEFEILAITSPEQRLIAGRVTTWEWAVVPRQAGPHELSVVVTNLTDARGNPIDLTVHSVNVEVQVKTMQKLKEVASLLSSAMGGLMSLLGMYKGVIAPLMNRRREKDGEASKDKSKDAPKDPPNDPPKDVGNDSAAVAKADSAAATPPVGGQSAS